MGNAGTPSLPAGVAQAQGWYAGKKNRSRVPPAVVRFAKGPHTPDVFIKSDGAPPVAGFRLAFSLIGDGTHRRAPFGSAISPTERAFPGWFAALVFVLVLVKFLFLKSILILLFIEKILILLDISKFLA